MISLSRVTLMSLIPFERDCTVVLFLSLLLLLSNSKMIGPVASQDSMESTLVLRVDPSSVTIKVGDNATVNLMVSNPGQPRSKVCFGQQGFPDSGFDLTFSPTCTLLPTGSVTSLLTVVATPAAAPQNFTASILAVAGNQSAQAALTVTVIPGLPPWIPWLIIIVFFLFLAIAVTVNPKTVLRKIRRSSKK